MIVAYHLASISKILLLISLFIACMTQASIPAVPEYNRYMFASSHKCVLTIGNASTDLHDEYFSSIFPNTIEIAQHVYYSTQSIDARIYDNSYIYNTNNINLEYLISRHNITQTSLVTRVGGYLVDPLYKFFTFRYLLIFANNPWINTYVVIQNFVFTTTTHSISTAYPSKYSSGNDIRFSVQIRDVKFQCSYNDLTNSSSPFKINWWWDLSPALQTFTINFHPPDFFGYLSYNRVRFLVIIIDTTAMAADFPNYVFYAGNINMGGNSNTVSLSQTTQLKYGNYMFGLCAIAIRMYGQPSCYFDLTNSGYQIRSYLNGYGNNTYGYWYSYAYFLYFTCSNWSYPNFNPSDRQCYQTICNTSYYLDANNNTCLSCRFDCLTCKNSYQCLTCNTTIRYFSNYSCLPTSGYFESNVTQPFLCDNSTCRKCQNTSTTCTACPLYISYFVNNTCIRCWSVLRGCHTCNMTHCHSCINGYRFINSTFCNLVCDDINCFICKNVNTSICQDCRYGYILDPSTTTCFLKDPSSTCGNGKIEKGQACDDGNLKQLDGCNYLCQIQLDYNCYTGYSTSGNYTSYCAYKKPIDFTPISIQKLEYSNEIQIVLSIVPYQHKFWSTQSTLSYFLIQTPIPYRNMRIQFTTTTYSQSSKLATPITKKYPQSSLMKITFEYLKSIQGQSIMLGFNFSSSIDTSLTEIPPYSVSLVVNPQNNRYAHLYSQNIYKNQKMLYNICLLAAVLSFVLFIVSLVIGSKRIIVEMLIVIQITYVSLIAVPQLSPMYSALTVLSIANNGFNVMYSSSLRPFEDTLSDQRTKGVQLYSQLLYNINTGLLFIIIPLLIGLVMFIVSKAKDLSQERLAKVKSIYQKALGEYTFVGLMFGGCIIGASTVIEIKYGMVDISTQVGLFSLVATGVLPILYILYAVIRVKCPHLFDEYTQQLNSSNQFSLVFQITCFFLWPSLSAIVCVFYSVWFINCIIIVLCFILYIITLIKPIFMKPIDRYRTQLNLLTILFAQIPYLYANVRTGYQYKDDNQLSIMAPAAIGFLLMINLLANLSYFTYETLKKIRQFFANKQPKYKIIDIQNHDFLKTHISNTIKVDFIIQITEKDEESYRSLSSVKKAILPLNKDYKLAGLQEQQSIWAKNLIVDGDYIHNKFDQIGQI